MTAFIGTSKEQFVSSPQFVSPCVSRHKARNREELRLWRTGLVDNLGYMCVWRRGRSRKWGPRVPSGGKDTRGKPVPKRLYNRKKSSATKSPPRSHYPTESQFLLKPEFAHNAHGGESFFDREKPTNRHTRASADHPSHGRIAPLLTKSSKQSPSTLFQHCIAAR